MPIKEPKPSKRKPAASFHHGHPDRSVRLAKLLRYLRRKRRATTMEIALDCMTTRPISDVSELRRCGHNIDAEYIHTTEDCRRIFRYTFKR